MAFFALSVGATTRIIALRISVPALLPVTPAFASTASIVNSSCVLSANIAEADRLMNASPISSMVVAERFAALAHWSISVPMSSKLVPVVFIILMR